MCRLLIHADSPCSPSASPRWAERAAARRRPFPASGAQYATQHATQHATQSATREQTADQQVHHVLNRLAFGARPGDMEALRAMGVDAWIDRQLAPERIADAATERFMARCSVLGKTGEQSLTYYPPSAAVLAQRQRRGGPVTAEDSARLRAQGRQSSAFRASSRRAAWRVP